MMQQLTPVIKNIIIINVLVYLCVYVLPMGEWLPDLKLYFGLDDQFRPYQIITHMFMHSGDGPRHLLFNMLSLYFLGVYVERYIGNRDFFILYILSGLGAVIAHQAIDFIEYSSTGIADFYPVLGASGAVFGVIISFVVLFPNIKLMLLFIPYPIKAKYLGIAFIALDVFLGFGGFRTGIAHFAHLGGALTGALLTYLWLKPKYSRP